MNNFKILMNGIIKENPTFVLLLGMCPTLGTTSSAINGMGMGLATMAVLVCSNIVISCIKNIVPDMVRIPSFIVVIASLVTILQMVMQAFVPGLYATLGLFIPLIVVNCLILGRAEAFAAKILQRGANQVKFLVIDDQKAVVECLACLDRKTSILRIEFCDVACGKLVATR